MNFRFYFFSKFLRGVELKIAILVTVDNFTNLEKKEKEKCLCEAL